jgi:hypothetical protein
MATIVTRTGKGSVLTIAEMDANLTNLNDDLASKASSANPSFTGAVAEALDTSSVTTLDLSTSACFKRTIATPTTFALSNVPSGPKMTCFVMDFTNAGSAAITWWSGVKWAGGTAPTLTTAGRDVLGFMTTDGGATWVGVLMAKDAK